MENDIIYFSDFPNLQETGTRKELKRKNEKLQKALRKQDLNFIKNL